MIPIVCSTVSVLTPIEGTDLLVDGVASVTLLVVVIIALEVVGTVPLFSSVK